VQLEADFIRRARLQVHDAAGKSIWNPIERLVVRITKVAIARLDLPPLADSIQRQVLTVLCVALPPELHFDRGVAVVVARDPPLEPKTDQCWPFDNQLARLHSVFGDCGVRSEKGDTEHAYKQRTACANHGGLKSESLRFHRKAALQPQPT
jgi:hypothetical protein